MANIITSIITALHNKGFDVIAAAPFIVVKLNRPIHPMEVQSVIDDLGISREAYQIGKQGDSVAIWI